MRSWSGLTDAERNSWSAASELPVSGINRYTVANSLLAMAGLPLIASYSGSGLLTTPSAGWHFLTASTQESSESTYNGSLPTNIYLLFYATAGNPAGAKFFPPSAYVYLASQAPGTYPGGYFDLSTPYQAMYGQPIFRYNVGLKIVAINVASGDWSDESLITGAVTL